MDFTPQSKMDFSGLLVKSSAAVPLSMQHPLMANQQRYE